MSVTTEQGCHQARSGQLAVWPLVLTPITPGGWMVSRWGQGTPLHSSSPDITTSRGWSAGPPTVWAPHQTQHSFMSNVSLYFHHVHIVIVTFVDGPIMTQHPDSVSVRQGASAKFSCSATGSPPPKYTWFKLDGGGDGVAVGEGAQLVLVGSGVTVGRYYCQARVGTNTVNSSPATLSLISQPTISTVKVTLCL